MTLHDLFPALLNMSLTASAVIFAVLLVRLLLRRAPKMFSYVLWAVVLFRLLCPISFEAPFGVTQAEVVDEDYAFAGESISFAGAAEAAYRAVGDAANGGLGVQHVRTTETYGDGTRIYVSANWFEVWVLFGGYVWLGGIAVLLIRAVWQTVRLRRRLIGAVPLERRVWLADHIDTPFVMGLFRPRIYLPSTLGEAEREYILLHERHHIRRGDHVMRLLAFAALCLHWFNPLVWVAFVLSGKDMEMSCDEAVMRRMEGDIRADYSESLLRLATGKRVIVGSPLAFGEGDTKDRVKNVMKYRKPVVWLSVIAAIVLVLVITVLSANAGSGKCEVLMGANYSTVEVIYDITDVGSAEPAKQYSIAEKDLYSRDTLSEEWTHIGSMEQYPLTREELLSYMQREDAWLSSARKIGSITDAYILRGLVNDYFYLAIQTDDGETLLAHGWEDVSERGQAYSDDTFLFWLRRLESDFVMEAFHPEFFGRILEKKFDHHVDFFGYQRTENYIILGFMYDEVATTARDMSGVGYAVFRSFRGKGYDLWGAHHVDNAVTTNNGIHIDTSLPDIDVFDWKGRRRETDYDVILSTNADLSRIVYEDQRGREQSISVRGIYSMTLVPRDEEEEERAYTFYDTFGQQIIVELPERVRVSQVTDNHNTGTVTLSGESARTVLDSMANAPWVELDHPVYQEGTTFRNGFVVRVEHVVREEYVLHDDMVDCFVWEYNGEYFLDGYKYPEDGKHIQQISSYFYKELFSLFEPLPERIVITKYLNEESVGTVTLTEQSDIWYWYREMALPETIITLAMGTNGMYENGYAVRLEFADGRVLDCHVWKTDRDTRYIGYSSSGELYVQYADPSVFEELSAMFFASP